MVVKSMEEVAFVDEISENYVLSLPSETIWKNQKEENLFNSNKSVRMTIFNILENILKFE